MQERFAWHSGRFVVRCARIVRFEGIVIDFGCRCSHVAFDTCLYGHDYGVCTIFHPEQYGPGFRPERQQSQTGYACDDWRQCFECHFGLHIPFPTKNGDVWCRFCDKLSPDHQSGHPLDPFRKKEILAILKHKLTRPAIKDILNLGSSTFIMEVSSAVVLTTFNLLILGLEGNKGVAAYGIVANIAFVAVAIFTGLGQGVQPLISKYYGLKDRKTVRRVNRYALLTAGFIVALIYLGTFFNSEALIGLFNNENDPVILRLADSGMKIYFLGFFFVGINIVTAMILSATEKGRAAFCPFGSEGTCCYRTDGNPLEQPLGMTGIWSSFVLSELIVAGFALYLTTATEKGNHCVWKP